MISSITHMQSGTEIKYERVKTHPNYKYDELKNDICLIKEQFNYKRNAYSMQHTRPFDSF